MLLSPVEKEPAEISAQPKPVAPLSPLEMEVIDFFVQISLLLGQPKSLAEIYGLLFISERPLALEDVIERLHMSRGGASQGLKFLRTAGALRTAYVPGARRMHYEPVAELRKLVTRFLQERIVPQLDNSGVRLERIMDLLKQLSPEDRVRVNGRIKMLQSWQKNSRRVLPLLVKILGM